MKKTMNILKAIGLIILFSVITLFISMLLLTISKMIFGSKIDFIDEATQMGYEGLFQSISIAIVSFIFYYLFKIKHIFAGWPKLRTSLIGFKNGIFIGLFMAGGMFIFTYIFGGGRFSLDGSSWSEYFTRIIPLLFFVLVATLWEEWLFRGFPLTILSKATSPGWANIIFSLLFVLIHISSAGFNTIVAFNIFLGSIVVGTLRFTSGGIPMAWGFHFAWNSLQVILGSTLSGIKMEVPVLHFTGIGQDWVSGGEMGPEGSIGAMLSTLLVLIIITRHMRRKKNYDLPLPLSSFFINI